MTKINEEIVEEVVAAEAAEAVAEEKPAKKTRKTTKKAAEAVEGAAAEEKPAKKTTRKSTKKATEAVEGAEEEKKPAKKPAARKKTVKANVNVQFAGKEYTTEKLVEIAKDVWQYDLGNDVADFKSVELYVKPEESSVYYVINEEVTGSFAI